MPSDVILNYILTHFFPLGYLTSGRTLLPGQPAEKKQWYDIIAEELFHGWVFLPKFLKIFILDFIMRYMLLFNNKKSPGRNTWFALMSFNQLCS